MQQLGIEFQIARNLAQEGQQRALDRAEGDVPGWGALALEWLRRYAQTHEQFPGWFVTEEAGRDVNFPAPASSKAWGAVWKQAQRENIVMASGKTLPHPRRHGCPAVIWLSLVYRLTSKAE